MDEWAGAFRGILRSFFETGDDEASELQVLRACFEKLSRAGKRAEFDQPVELAVVLEQLNRDLSGDPFGAGYLTGGITFCALKPMRSIPAKVICLLGMNNGLSRTSAQLSFDLMAQERRLGDRSSREDDRYLFLETLISARRKLYISYVGQSIKDNSEAPPSVLVSELLDYISQGFELPGQDIVRDHVLTRHRLQAFSSAYFGGGRLFSYSRENLQASRVIAPERKAPRQFRYHRWRNLSPNGGGLRCRRWPTSFASRQSFLPPNDWGYVCLPRPPRWKSVNRLASPAWTATNFSRSCWS